MRVQGPIFTEIARIAGREIEVVQVFRVLLEEPEGKRKGEKRLNLVRRSSFLAPSPIPDLHDEYVAPVSDQILLDDAPGGRQGDLLRFRKPRLVRCVVIGLLILFRSAS